MKYQNWSCSHQSNTLKPKQIVTVMLLTISMRDLLIICLGGYWQQSPYQTCWKHHLQETLVNRVTKMQGKKMLTMRRTEKQQRNEEKISKKKASRTGIQKENRQNQISTTVHRLRKLSHSLTTWNNKIKILFDAFYQFSNDELIEEIVLRTNLYTNQHKGLSSPNSSEGDQSFHQHLAAIWLL